MSRFSAISDADYVRLEIGRPVAIHVEISLLPPLEGRWGRSMARRIRCSRNHLSVKVEKAFFLFIDEIEKDVSGEDPNVGSPLIINFMSMSPHHRQNRLQLLQVADIRDNFRIT